MPKRRKKRVGSPKTPNPVKEMQWCFSKHIYVTWEVEATFNGVHYEEGNKYRVVIRQGEKLSETEYIYHGDEIIDKVNETYRQLYQINNGKKTKVKRD